MSAVSVKRRLAYYNENDPFAAAWLRELIKVGLIADGEVDERSIELVQPDDLRGFVQCHFFAGIGGWSYALRLAGWPDDRAVWTGSCPCQPWSMAGAGGGTEDPRHLWPAWKRLIEVCRPPIIFGEQTPSEDGKYWCDLVCNDVESLEYAFGAAVLPATCVGAPEGRHRLWFVADSTSARSSADVTSDAIKARRGTQLRREGARMARQLGEPNCQRLEVSERVRSLQDATTRTVAREAAIRAGMPCDCGHLSASHDYGTDDCDKCSCLSFVANTNVALSGYQRLQRSWRLVQLEEDPLVGFWSGAEWLRCDDGKIRPVESSTFPLAHGVSNRVGRLRGYGNAIVPQVAQVFIEAYMSLIWPR